MSSSAVQEDLRSSESATGVSGGMFEKPRKQFQKRVLNLASFCGGQTTKFSRTATIESDFSKIQREADKYCTTLSN